MILIKPTTEETNFIEKNFNFCELEDMQCIDSNSIKKYILGEDDIRLKDYKGDSQDFYDDVYLSMTDGNKGKKLYLQYLDVIETILEISLQNEYYILANNLKIIYDEMFSVGKEYSDNLKFNREIKKHLFDLGIKNDINEFPDEV